MSILREKYSAAAILLSSELGREMKAKRPLCFVEVDEKPLFVQAVDHLAASRRFREIILLLHDAWVGLGVSTAEFWKLNIVRSILAGREDPMETLERGIKSLNPAYEIVGIHDGARPVTRGSLVAEVMDEAHNHGFAVAARPLSSNENPPDRDRIIENEGNRFALQSPYGIRQSILRDLFKQRHEKGLTALDLYDLAVECGISPVLVPSTAENPRVVVPEDLQRCLEVIKQSIRRKNEE